MNELPGNIIFLWLEDIIEDQTLVWTIEQYSLIARHLGRLNGSFVERENQSRYPWLSLHRNHSWIKLMSWDVFPWDHPKALIRYRHSEHQLHLKNYLIE